MNHRKSSLKSIRTSLGKLADKEKAQSYVTPPFSLKQIRDQIPLHCFKKNTMVSLGYLLHDLILVSLLVLFATNIHQLPPLVQPLAWIFYWIMLGIVGTGLWILAHECGHSAFSDYPLLNNVVGFCLHTALLVPFFSWKFTHSKHHKGTNHMEKDHVFVPASRSDYEQMYGYEKTGFLVDPIQDDEPLTMEAPLWTFFNFIRMELFGWPYYLIANATSQKHPEWVSHFFPNAPIFEDRERHLVFASNIGILSMLGFLTLLGQTYGFNAFVSYYLIPYLFVNAWLVLITFLQHTDPVVPRYRNQDWDFMKGALATIDRDFGILNYFFHHITDTHVVHHLFSQMPFYHAQEATEAVKPFLGKYYLSDNTHWFVAAMNVLRTCKFVEDQGDTVFFKY